MVATTLRPDPELPHPPPECLNSARHKPCHVPNSNLPLDIGTVIELPTSDVLRCDTESLDGQLIVHLNPSVLTLDPRPCAPKEVTLERLCPICGQNCFGVFTYAMSMSAVSFIGIAD